MHLIMKASSYFLLLFWYGTYPVWSNPKDKKQENGFFVGPHQLVFSPQPSQELEREPPPYPGEGPNAVPRVPIVQGWRSISLRDGAPFEEDAQYRVKLYCSNNAPCSGWYYPTIMTPGMLYLDVSTAQFAWGVITHDEKRSWHYRKKGDAANRPAGYENTKWGVAEIQVLSPSFAVIRP